MELNKYVKISSISGISISVISILVINTLQRGNFIAGPLYSIIITFIIMVQMVATIIVWREYRKWKLYTTLSIILLSTTFDCMMLYQYIFKMVWFMQYDKYFKYKILFLLFCVFESFTMTAKSIKEFDSIPCSTNNTYFTQAYDEIVSILNAKDNLYCEVIP